MMGPRGMDERGGGTVCPSSNKPSPTHFPPVRWAAAAMTAMRVPEPIAIDMLPDLSPKTAPAA